MDHPFADIFRLAPELAEALQPAELAALEHALSEADPAVLKSLEQWLHLRRQVADDLAGDIPPPGMLVLYAMAEEPDVLSEAEAARLQEARGQVERVLGAHPGLQSVVERVRADRDAFYRMWEEAEAKTNVPARRAPDREALFPARSNVSPSRRWVSRSIIAGAVLIFAATLFILSQRELGFETVRTAEGETREVVLADGSEVQLAPNTTLAFNVTADRQRVVQLTGEAVFQVVPAPERFVVETQDAQVVVIGTTFAVSADAGATEVVLVRGAVEIHARHAPDEIVRLSPGQRSRVAAGQVPERPQPADVSSALAWTGTWYFQAEPLHEIASRLSRHFGVRIHVPADLQGERVSGTFRQDAPLEQTLQTLASALGTQVDRDAAGDFRFAMAPG
jgi:transmembrane sensor